VWRNWAGDQRCEPADIVRPASRPDLIDSVAQAADAGRTVRVAGSGHSFTDIGCTDGVMLDVSRLNRVLEVDRSSGLVRVEAGIVIGDLARVLDADGFAMDNQGDIDRQTLAGAISTATHGTGARFQNLSAQVEAVELVLADGTIHECSADADPDGLLAARAGLGALGALYSVTLRTVPAYTIRRVDHPEPLEQIRTTTSSSTYSRTPTPRSCARASARTSLRGPGGGGRSSSRRSCWRTGWWLPTPASAACGLRGSRRWRGSSPGRLGAR
jgi:FAD/FMN-containing dehydrogenase